MQLREREGPLIRFADRLDMGAAGRGGTVFVSGPAGCGKSALLEQFAATAVAKGSAVLCSEGMAGDETTPLRLLADLRVYGGRTVAGSLHPLSQNLGDLSDPEQAKRAIARFARNLTRVLTHSATGDPVVVVLDDIQHADDISVRLLLRLMRLARSMPALLVLGESAHHRSVHPLIHTELMRDESCLRIQLEPLSESGIAALADDRDHPYDAADLFARSGGNPLLALALIEDRRRCDAAGQSPAEDSHTQGGIFSSAVATCVSGTRPVVVSVACAIAMLGGQACAETLSRALAQERSEVETALEELGAIGLLDRGRFRDPATNAAVLRVLTPQARRDLHWRVAHYLQDTGAPARSIARHMVASGHTTVEGWTVPVLLDAAQEADVVNDPTLALTCLKLARVAAPSGPERDQLGAMMIRSQWRYNPAATRRDLTAVTDGVLEGRLPTADALRLLRALLWYADLDAAGRVLAHLESAAETGGDPRGAAQVGGIRLRLRCLYPDLVARNPVADVDHLPFDPGVRAAWAFAETLTRGGSTATLTVAEGVLREAILDDEVIDSVEDALRTMLIAGRAEAAARHCDRLFEQARNRSANTWLARLAALRGEICLKQGLPDQAYRWAGEAFGYLPARSWGAAGGAPRSTLIRAAVDVGDLDTAEEQLRQPLPSGAARSLYGVWFRFARGRHHVAGGRWYEALADFVECGRFAAHCGLDLDGLIPWRAAADAVNAELGLPDFGLIPGTPGLLHRVASPSELAPGSANPSRVAGTPPGLWAGIREHEPSKPCDALSEAELRVAELASLGSTNREVAQTLFITVSTVEQHLTRIYKKLNVSGRHELPALGLAHEGSRAS